MFLNSKEAKTIRLTFEELGHPQPPTPMYCNNETAAGIANNTVKRQPSHSMEIRYFYIGNLVKHEIVNVKWHPGKENLADYASKHQDAKHNKTVQRLYLQYPKSPHELLRALTPHVLRGCVGTKLGGIPRPLRGLEPSLVPDQRTQRPVP